MGEDALGESPMASIYAHYRGARWHATGLVGAGRTTLQLDRPIDLGAAGMHVAHSRRELGQAFVHGEVGRRVLLGKGQLTPFVAVDYSALHSDSFSEQGDTGFELVAQPGRSNQLSAAAGTRYTRDWIFGGNGWLQLNLDARYQRRLHDGGDAQQAAFLGVPDAVFDLRGWSRVDGFGVMDMGLAGGFGERWTWSADYARRFGTGAGHGGWFLGLRRDF
jgi:outer membrane autotransporter protein